MVPPFMAYYGVLTRNRSAVAESYNQIRLYRGYLRDGGSNLWRHMALGGSQDTNHWSTGSPRTIPLLVRLILIRFYGCQGNSWAAAGMLRVLGTIKNSEYAGDFKSEQKDLINWVLEIQDGMYNYLVRST
jgi:rhamnogalacturonyl hydrolase YesR